MIVEIHEVAWQKMTDVARLALAGKPNVRIRLYSLTITKRGVKRTNERFVEW